MEAQGFVIAAKDIASIPSEWGDVAEAARKERHQLNEHQKKIVESLKRSENEIGENKVTKWFYFCNILLTCLAFILWIGDCLTKFVNFKNSRAHKKLTRLARKQMAAMCEFVMKRYDQCRMRSFLGFELGMCIISNLPKLDSLTWQNNKEWLNNSKRMQGILSKEESFYGYICSKHEKFEIVTLSDVLLLIVSCYLPSYYDLVLFDLIYHICPQQVLLVLNGANGDTSPSQTSEENNEMRFTHLFIVESLQLLGSDRKMVEKKEKEDKTGKISNMAEKDIDLKYLLQDVNLNANSKQFNDYLRTKSGMSLAIEILGDLQNQSNCWTTFCEKSSWDEMNARCQKALFDEYLVNYSLEYDVYDRQAFWVYVASLLSIIEFDMKRLVGLEYYVYRKIYVVQELLSSINFGLLDIKLSFESLNELFVNYICDSPSELPSAIFLQSILKSFTYLDNEYDDKYKHEYEYEFKIHLFLLFDKLFMDSIVSHLNRLIDDRSHYAIGALEKYYKAKNDLFINEIENDENGNNENDNNEKLTKPSRILTANTTTEEINENNVANTYDNNDNDSVNDDATHGEIERRPSWVRMFHKRDKSIEVGAGNTTDDNSDI